MNSNASKTRFPITCIFDTETTGIPPKDPTGKHLYAPYSKWGNQCRVLQLAWQIRDTDGSLLHSYDAFVRPDGFTIPEAASAVHSITDEFLNEQPDTHCKPIATVLKDLFDTIDTYAVECLVAHNLTFDYNVIAYELHKTTKHLKTPATYQDKWRQLQGYCTYKQGRHYLTKRAIRHPGKLTDYYSYFVEPWETCDLKHTTTLHRADSDVEVCRRLYERLYPLTVDDASES